MSVIGVDPGISGALALYDATGLYVDDMPTFGIKVGKSIRKRVDAVALLEQLELYQMMGGSVVILEEVGGRPAQGASAAYVLGTVSGMIYMACVALKLPIEMVPPQKWKKALSVPGKKDAAGDDKAAADAIMRRAQEIMPHEAHKLRGPMGGAKLDRAEAAMLAYYGFMHNVGAH